MKAVIKESAERLAPVMTKAMNKAAEQADKSGLVKGDDQGGSTSGLDKHVSTQHAKPSKGKPPPRSKASKGAKTKGKGPAQTPNSDSDDGTSSSSSDSVDGEEKELNSDTEDETSIPLNDVNELTISKEEIKSVQQTDPLLIQFRKIAEKKSEVDEADDKDVAAKFKLQSEHRKLLMKLPTRVEQGNAQHMSVDCGGLIVYAMSNGHWPVPAIDSQLGERMIAGAHDSLAMVYTGSRKVLHWDRQRYWWHKDVQAVPKDEVR